MIGERVGIEEQLAFAELFERGGNRALGLRTNRGGGGLDEGQYYQRQWER